MVSYSRICRRSFNRKYFVVSRLTRCPLISRREGGDGRKKKRKGKDRHLTDVVGTGIHDPGGVTCLVYIRYQSTSTSSSFTGELISVSNVREVSFRGGRGPNRALTRGRGEFEGLVSLQFET